MIKPRKVSSVKPHLLDSTHNPKPIHSHEKKIKVSHCYLVNYLIN